MGNEDEPADCSRYCSPGERVGTADAGDQYANHTIGQADNHKQSYSIGVNVGKSLHRDSIDVEPKIVLQGLEDALADGKLLLTDDQMKTVMTALQTQVRQKLEEKRQTQAETDQKDGAAFMAANATKEGVVTLPSGLQYKIMV